MATRALFTDDSEVYFQAIKPVILNGIEDVVTRSDLADRSIVLNLPTIALEDRIDHDIFWARFKDRRPMILGALLDLMSTALARLPTLKTDRLPRMAGCRGRHSPALLHDSSAMSFGPNGHRSEA